MTALSLTTTKSCLQASGAAKDATKKLNPNSTDLPSLGGAADKGAGNVKDAANSAKSSAKNLASDLSENPLAGLGDKVSEASQSLFLFSHIAVDSLHAARLQVCMLQDLHFAPGCAQGGLFCMV